MIKSNYSSTNCLELSPSHDFDLTNKKRSCTRYHQHECCCCCCPNSHCRKVLCDTDFSIRLGGLQDGLNFRLRQLLWCDVEFELDDGKIIYGTIITVGSNFVEVLVISRYQVEEIIVEVDEDDLYKDLTQKEHKPDEKCEKRNHEKGQSWIFSTDKIAIIKIDHSSAQ